MSLVPQILVTIGIHVASEAYCVVMDITPDMQCVLTRSSLLSIEHQHILKA